MRDLASRLRSIVKQDHGGGRSAPSIRELTYIPDSTPAITDDLTAAQQALGGRPLESHPGCIVIDRVWEADAWHGRAAVGSFVMREDAPLSMFEPRALRWPGWSRRVVFFDLETTGLSGGAGTLAFLAGCGWFEGEAFRVRQFLLASPAAERAMLDALAGIFDEASLLVTFNGRSFDVPLMESRWAFHRASAASDDVPHFDMLPTSRRLWGLREDSYEGCRLSSLERSVLGFRRVGDVPGFEIPGRYFHFLRTGERAAVMGVLEHNQHDLVSLAGVMAHALSLVQDGPEGCRESCEQLALGRLYEQAGQRDLAVRSYQLAAERGDGDVRLQALSRLATSFGRSGRHGDAAETWQAVLDHARRFGAPPALERRAVEALAIHHEHRARDLSAARRFAERLSRQASGRARQDAAHRLGRIEKKMGANEKGSLLP